MLSLNNVTVDLGHASRRCCRCDRYLFAVSFLCFQHPPPPPPSPVPSVFALSYGTIVFYGDSLLPQRTCSIRASASSLFFCFQRCHVQLCTITTACAQLRELFTSYFDSNDCFPKRQFLCPKRQRFAKWTVHFACSCLFNPEPPNLTGGLRT
jgi:hypothetical protein